VHSTCRFHEKKRKKIEENGGKTKLPQQQSKIKRWKKHSHFFFRLGDKTLRTKMEKDRQDTVVFIIIGEGILFPE